MKSTALLDPEMDSLLSEVRHLRASVADLETRLAEYEGDEEDRWAIWPYCWVVQGWEQSERQLNTWQQKLERWSVSRRNKRQLRAAHNRAVGEMHLT